MTPPTQEQFPFGNGCLLIVTNGQVFLQFKHGYRIGIDLDDLAALGETIPAALAMIRAKPAEEPPVEPAP